MSSEQCAPRTAAALVEFTKAGLALGQHFVVCLTCRPHTGVLQPCLQRDDLVWKERLAGQVLAAALVDERVLERLTAAESVVAQVRRIQAPEDYTDYTTAREALAAAVDAYDQARKGAGDAAD